MADSFEFVPTRFQGIRGLGISRCLISGSVVVPSSSNGLPVIGVMRESFSNLSSLKEVELPDSLLFIQDEAFERCYSLKTIILPVSLVKIGEKAFSSCCSLETSKYRGTEEQWKQVASGRGNDGFLKTLCFGNRNSLETESSGRKVTLSIGEKLYLRSNEEIELIAILDESHIRISQGAGRRVDFSVKDFGNKFFDKTGLQIYQENKESILRQEAEARAEESQKQVQKSREEARRKIEKEQERKSLEEQWNREAHWLDESRPSPAFNSKPELPIERPKLDFLVDGENEEIADIDVSNLPVDLPIPSSGVSEGKPFFLPPDLVDSTPEQTFLVRITGINHDHRDSAVSHLLEGQELFMVPEPNNHVDNHCIRVFTLSKEDVGFVSVDFNRSIFEQLCEGYRFRCFVESLDAAFRGYYFLMRVQRYSKE